MTIRYAVNASQEEVDAMNKVLADQRLRVLVSFEQAGADNHTPCGKDYVTLRPECTEDRLKRRHAPPG